MSAEASRYIHDGKVSVRRYYQ